MKKDAYLSMDLKYRYMLERTWDESKGLVLFVGLNPSTADSKKDDPTIRRCIGYAESWGYGGLLMGNLFAFRATDPKELLSESDPAGEENDFWLQEMNKRAEITIACWGQSYKFISPRDQEVWKMLKPMHFLSLTKKANPGHPLYLNMKLKPKPWDGKAVWTEPQPKKGLFRK